MSLASPIPPESENGAITSRSGKLALSGAEMPRPKISPRARQHYQQMQIETASPTRLVILLYDGAIRFCSLAQAAMQEGDLEKQHLNLIKAQRILGELMSSLDRKTGGEVAENLFRLYVHMLEQLVEANLHDKCEPIENVMKMMGDLRDSWQEIDRRTTQEPTTPGEGIRHAA